MGLYKADDNAGGFVHADAEKLARQLQQGDGILWTGDPRLELVMATFAPKGKTLARRYEVYRNNEDGTRLMIGHWRLEEFDKILMDLAPMRMGAPGREDVLDRIDRENAEAEKATTAKFVDSAGAALEHRLKLEHDVHEGRNVFRQMPGMRDIETVSASADVKFTPPETKKLILPND